MDERQAQIRERAGLEESRLNVEFIDWLRKWGTPLLFLAAAASAVVWAKNYFERSGKEKVDRAFIELHQASGQGNPNPDALAAVAAEYDGVRAVGLLARLEAADAYLRAVARGLKVGAVITLDAQGNPTGELQNADDVLTDADREQYLARAGTLYAEVYERAKNEPARVLLALNAMYGMAAVHESRGELEDARRWYEQIADLTKDGTYSMHAAVALRRITSMDRLKEPLVLPTRAQVPTPPQPQAVTPPVPVTVPPPVLPAPSEPAPTEPAPSPTEPGPAPK
ncbi:MAG: hypothetical protein SFY69_12155 [Planctomycetota bacterium]|nr:hypothetical protein [Planctomycetota bacterium]